jgi:hypothetical protein
VATRASRQLWRCAGLAASTNATQGYDAVVCIVFGPVAATGSGIALGSGAPPVERRFGRRVLVTGIGIAPCGRRGRRTVARVFGLATTSLDALCDEGPEQR